MASRVGTTSVPLLYLFLVFQLVDQFFLSILIATFLLSKSVKRHPTVINVCLSWIITGVISSLLLYAGKHVGPEPPTLLCISQASLLDGVVPMNAVAVLALIYQVNFSIRHPDVRGFGLRTYVLLVIPYVTFFSFSMTAAFLAVQKPENANRWRRFFYCSFASPITNGLAVFSAVVLLTAFGYAIAISLFLRNNWGDLRQSGRIDLPFLIRVGVFVIYVFIGFILSVLSIFDPTSPFPDLFVASFGTALFLFLSTQPDVWRAWFRRSTPTQACVTKAWVIPVVENPEPDDMGFDFKDKESTQHDVNFEDIEATTKVHDLDFEGTNMAEGSSSSNGKRETWVTVIMEGTTHDLDVEGMETPEFHDLDLEDTNATTPRGGEETGVVHNNASLIPQKPWRPPLVDNTSDSVASRDTGLAYSYRFARPGMI